MLSPEDLLHLAEGAEDIAEKLHIDIIRRIVRRMMARLGRGEEYLFTAVDKWQIQTLQDAGFLLEEIQQDIAKATKLQQQEIAEAMEDAGVKAMAYEDEKYKRVGLYPKPLDESPHLIRIMQRNYEDAMKEWENFTRTIAYSSQQFFISEMDTAYSLVTSGALSYTQAFREVLYHVNESVKIKYPSGHQDTLETASLRALRTGVSQATAQIQIARMEEFGQNRVITSSHMGARPEHQKWQGKIFTLEELRSTDPGMPAYGTVTGICGANCRHNFSVYFEGDKNPFEDYDSEENKKKYEEEQRQRELERRIRRTKVDVMSAKTSVDASKDDYAKKIADEIYQKKAALLSKQTKEYNDYCAEKNLRPLQERLEVARWTRKQAAAARGAAQRYKNRKEKENGR